MKHLATLALCLAATPPALAASIEDFTTWSLVEDPPHPGMRTEQLQSESVRLVTSTVETIPSGTDIGFASVNGSTVASSSSGFAFDPASDFTIAVDYSLGLNLIGAGAIGFGIGEDVGGENSAGAAIIFALGDRFVSQARTAARINDFDRPSSLLDAEALLTGRLFLDYQSANGDVVVGISPTRGALAPTTTGTIFGVQRAWSDQPLLASFFVRSQSLPLATPDSDLIIIPPISAGTSVFEFSNFEVLSGTPIRVPEPASALLLAIAALSWRRRT